ARNAVTSPDTDPGASADPSLSSPANRDSRRRRATYPPRGGPMSADALARELGGRVSGDPLRVVTGAASLPEAKSDDLSFLLDPGRCGRAFGHAPRRPRDRASWGGAGA